MHQSGFGVVNLLSRADGAVIKVDLAWSALVNLVQRHWTE